MDEESYQGEVYRFRDIDFTDPNLLQLQPRKRRRSTVICTISNINITDVELQKMMETGMNVAKFKMSHFSKGDKMRMLAKVEQAARACCEKYGMPDWPIATCFELKTCNTKTGLLEQTLEFVDIIEGSEVIITNDVQKYDRCCAKQVFIDSMFLKENAKVGNEISLCEDGVILKITELIDDHSVNCVVIQGGKLGNIEQVSMTCVDYAEPLLSKRDYEILNFSMETQVDMIVINYVRCAETIKLARKYMTVDKKRPLFFAGICTNQCLANIDSIIQEADGIILSRHILPYELSREQRTYMGRIQKWLTAKCLKFCDELTQETKINKWKEITVQLTALGIFNKDWKYLRDTTWQNWRKRTTAGRAMYISGGVFEESVTNGIIYDTEIFDFTNSLFDGVSGFLINDCYDSDYAVNAFKIINEICGMVEPLTTPKSEFWKRLVEIQAPVNAAKAAAIACLAIADQSFSKAIIIPTVSGITAKCLLELRPSCIVYTVSTNNRISRKLAAFRCVVPLVYKESKFNKTWNQIVKERVKYAMEYAVKKGYLVYGDHYVTLQRGKDSSAYCDTVRIWQVSIFRKTTVECPE